MAVKGKVYKSPFAGFRVQTRSEAVMYHPATGVEINRIPALTAEFGIFGEEFDQPLPDGTTHKSASITGGFFDTADAAARLGWTDEEHETVIADLDRWCVRWPEAIQELSRQPAGKPFPTYDELDDAKVVEFAVLSGLVGEALAYEQENKNRKKVVRAFEDALEAEAAKAAQPTVEELTAA